MSVRLALILNAATLWAIEHGWGTVAMAIGGFVAVTIYVAATNVKVCH